MRTTLAHVHRNPWFLSCQNIYLSVFVAVPKAIKIKQEPGQIKHFFLKSPKLPVSVLLASLPEELFKFMWIAKVSWF
jgi:hypothetical protein